MQTSQRTRLQERIVTLGGGTGSFTMLSELKKVAPRLSAIVTMMDAGGSSRRLIEALEDAAEILNTAGNVIPVTLDHATLCAELDDGSVIHGEDAIDRPEGRPVRPIQRVYLDPEARASVRARKALERAETVLIGPGDLYTSIIPCLLVDGIAEAIRSCEGEVIYICNVMTKHGETDSFAASDFVRELHRYLGRRVDTALVSTSAYPQALLDAYAREHAYPVHPDLDEVRALVPRVLPGLFSTTERLIRHDAERVIMGIWPDPED